LAISLSTVTTTGTLRKLDVSGRGVDVRLQTPTCFGTDVPSTGSYNNKGVQAILPIYISLLLINTIKTFDF